MAPWDGPMADSEKGTFLKFRFADFWKMHFCWIFLGILEFYGKVSFEEKLTRMNFPSYACL